MSGGKRQGAGRKPGSKSRKTSEIALKAAGEGMTPLEYMLDRMRDPNEETSLRADMAKSAAPYIHPRLAAVEHSGKGGGPIQMTVSVEDAGVL
jgi:hypothetical protein